MITIAALWRYPVKSLGAEPLESAELTTEGIVGDRIVHVRGPLGLLTGRTRHGLLTVPTTTGPDGVPQVAGHLWHTQSAHDVVRAHAGAEAELAAYSGPERFDVLSLLVATDGAVHRFGHDVRRLRPNLLLAGVSAEDEPTWPGRAIAVGEVLIGV
ncbi:MAG: MOSC N-terminal beta barrel domain-containing protein, partial [Actinomycetota bacterium]|nr:MOSC N-terminal beta barrel domain-containing protein [Actinomycetota bacterium]